MISFEPTDDQKMVRDSVAQFAERTLRPRIREFERARALPDDVQQAAHAMGLPLAAFPEAVGGAGLGVVTQVLIEEELAHGDPAAAFALSGPGAYGWAALLFGGPEAGKKLLAPFAGDAAHTRFGAVAWGEREVSRDRPGLVTTAERAGAGWKLRGEKSFVLHADRAASFIVFAQVDAAKGWEGLGAFVVPRDTKGLRVLPRLDTLGLDAASFGGIALDDVELPADALLPHGGDTRRLVAFFATQALLVAARAVGLSRAAFHTTRDYCEQRKAFGKPIGHFQAIAFTLADRSMDLEAARAMVWRAAYHWDAVGQGAATPSNEPEERAALQKIAWAVSFALEAAMRAGDDAVQLHGGSGFMRDYPVEKWMRDAKQLQLCAMTAEHADQLAALIALDRPLDPALVLPSAESQNVFL
ncbi:MAG TPA: acyl-CoA dehydrogenase family protein [Polyangiaceae bacterium]|jgi:alkylation response protein AidB-like acyl-CoA dehydrogenase